MGNIIHNFSMMVGPLEVHMLLCKNDFWGKDIIVAQAIHYQFFHILNKEF